MYFFSTKPEGTIKRSKNLGSMNSPSSKNIYLHLGYSPSLSRFYLAVHFFPIGSLIIKMSCYEGAICKAPSVCGSKRVPGRNLSVSRFEVVAVSVCVSA